MKELSKEQMKKVMGGTYKLTHVGGGGSDDTCNCNSPDDCTATNELCMNSCGGKLGDKYQGKCGCPS